MTVYQKQALQGVTIFQNQAFRSPCLLKNIFRLLRRVAGIEVTGGADKAFSALYDIVVAVNQEKPVFFLELSKQPEETAVGAQNHADAPVFPELISVSQLDIGVSVLIIVFQSPLKNHAVGEKIIGPVALSPVAVAHEDDPGAVVKGQDGRGGIKLIEFCGEGRHVKPSLPGSSGRNQMKSVRKSTARKTLSSGSSGSCAGRNRMCAASRCRRKSCTKKRM